MFDSSYQVSQTLTDDLGRLLETIESRLDSIDQLPPEIFSTQLLLFQIRELLSQRIVAQHLDPVLKVAASEMELEGSKIDSAEDSQKVRKVSSCCPGWSSHGPVKVKRVLRRYATENVRSYVSHDLVCQGFTRFRLNGRLRLGYQTLAIYLEDSQLDLAKLPATNPKLPRKTALHSARRPVSKVWMFSLECAGLAHAGGLGEAVAGLSKTLALDSKLEVSVFLPSHGRHLDPGIREAYGLQGLSTFIAQGHRTGVNGLSYNYLAGIEKGSRDGVNYFLAKGLDSATSKRLDDPIIYGHETTFEKMSLLARTLGSYTEYLISMGRTRELPDLIHAHDWHMVPAGVLVKQRLQERGVVVPLVFTVHLLSGVSLPWHYASEDWCGIRDAEYSLRTDGKRVSTLKYSQVWRDVCRNSLEKFGCYTADYVTSVSNTYLTNDVHYYVGDIIRGKSGHIYNGCNWNPSEIESTLITDFGEIERNPIDGEPKRWDLREYLLTNAISKIGKESETEDPAGLHEDSAKRRDGSVEAFRSDGPLVLMTGRLSPQKGVDLLLEAVPLVRNVILETKFLLFLLPSSDSDLTKRTVEKAEKYPNNVRVILGRHPSI